MDTLKISQQDMLFACLTVHSDRKEKFWLLWLKGLTAVLIFMDLLVLTRIELPSCAESTQWLEGAGLSR